MNDQPAVALLAPSMYLDSHAKLSAEILLQLGDIRTRNGFRRSWESTLWLLYKPFKVPHGELLRHYQLCESLLLQYICHTRQELCVTECQSPGPNQLLYRFGQVE